MTLTIQSARRKDTTSGLGAMSHRHFATIAAIIAEFPTEHERQYVANMFASRLPATNPKFDQNRFLRACGAKEV